jgi:hypothetical protein
MRFNKFNDVVSWYERTKPMVSKNHTLEHDVRPIGDRDRKWERIKKIDENTYALVDGNYGNCIWGQRDPVMHELENTMAPITWMRREDGDFIRIRNHARSGCSVTRYNFLHWHLPDTLRFHYNQQGKHYVRHNGEDIQLPKCNVRAERVNGATRELRDDNIFLMFRANEDGTFTRVGDKLKVEVQRVDKELKKQWRERVDSFYAYCAAIAPMIDTSWSGKNDYANMIREHLTVPGANLAGAWVRDSRSIPVDLMRAVVTEEDHPMRVAVAALVISDIGGKRAIESQDDIRQIKAAYNRVMNKSLGFYKIEEK